MKKLGSKLSAAISFILFPMHLVARNGSKYVCSIIVLMMVVSLTSCYLHFYRTNTRASIDANTLKNLQSRNKYFIVHFPNGTKGLEQISLHGDTLQGNLVPLTGAHLKYLYPSSPEKTEFKKADRDSVLIEVHLYTNDTVVNAQTLLSTGVLSFNRADIYEYNESATRKSKILSTIGISVTGAVVVGALAYTALLIVCNCPQVYVIQNGEYQFKSGLYSGAVYSNLERMDYLPLAGVETDAKQIAFKISNTKKEEQFINKVQLMQVNHLAGTYILPDRHGNIFSFASPTPPLSVTTHGKTDIRNALIKTDEQYYSFDNTANEYGFSDLLLTFDKPVNTDKAKLIIHARNTYWGGLIYKEFIHLFGDNFERWKTKQEKVDPSKLQKWQTDQALPLMVYLKTSNGWKFVDYFPLIGNTASRDMILEINTSAIKQDKIELKLETMYKFWDLDFAAMDFTTNEDLTTTAIEPDEILSPGSSDPKDFLTNNDKKYVHLTGNESIYFKYTVPKAPDNQVSTYFIASGGYYHNLEKITGKTDYAQLIKFKKPGAFDKFSRKKYSQAQEVAEKMNSINK